MAQPPFDSPARYEDVELIFRNGQPGAEDPRTVGEAFGRIEEDFARALDESLAPRGSESLDDLLAETQPSRGGVAVDVGCGRGRDAVRLARRFGLRVHGVDPVASNVEKTEALAVTEGVEGRVEAQLGCAEAIPLADGSVDVLWCKEVLTFTDLDTAMGEFHRVLRPGGVGVFYQVLTGPTMSMAEATWLASQEMGFGTARSLRPAEVEEAIINAGLEIRRRVDFGSEWGEAGQEREGAAGRRLTHVARLIRAPQRYIDRYGATNYRIMLADCLWHVYRMIGKLWGVAFLVTRPA